MSEKKSDLPEAIVASIVERDKPAEELSFSISLLQDWANACNHTIFRIADSNEVRIDSEDKTIDGKTQIFTIVYLPQNPTLVNLLKAARLLNEKRGAINPPSKLKRFSHNLKQSAILLAKQKELEGSANNILIEVLYQLGVQIEELSKQNSLSEPKTRESIQKEELIPYNYVGKEVQELNDIDSALLDDYKNQLFLFLLGKNSVRQQTSDNPKNDARGGFYYSLFRRWRLRKRRDDNKYILDPDNLLRSSGGNLKINFEDDKESLKEEFEKWLKNHKNILLDWLKNYAITGLEEQDSATHQGLTTGWQRGTQQELDQAVFDQSEQHIVDNLLEPAAARLDPSLINALTELGLETNLIQDTLFKKFQTICKNPNFKDKTLEEQLQLLANYVGKYEFAITIKINKAIETQAFECNLRSYFLGLALIHFYPDITVGVDSINNHVRLIVYHKKSKQEDFEIYLVDTTKTFNGSNIAQKIHDPDFLTKVDRAITSDPDHWSLLTTLNHRFFEKKHLLGNFQNLIQAAFWHNLGTTYPIGDPKRRKCFQKAVDLDPNFASAWNNLGTTYPKGDPKRRKCFQKAVDLNPDLININNLLIEYDYLINSGEVLSKTIKTNLLKLIERIEIHFPDNYTKDKQ